MSTQHGPVHPGDVDETVASFHGVHSAREIYARYCEVAGKIFYSIW